MSGAGFGVQFWGVRGSVGVSGARTSLFGGHTSCIEITAGRERLIVDAGTGIVPFGLQLQPKAGDHYDILLTHLHHDHVIGLMLFQPCFVDGVSIDVYCGNLGGASGEEALRRLFSPPLFPLTFEDLAARVRFIGFSAGDTLTVGGVSVQTCPLNHPNGATGYRFNHGDRTVAVLTDMEHEGGVPTPTLVDFCRDADLVIYDASYDRDDYLRYAGWGHSTWEAGAALAGAANAKSLACFHHAPEYDDDRLTRMEKALKEQFPAGFFAREGGRVVFGP